MSYYPLYYQIDSGLNLAKAPVIMGSASGSVASFPDGAADLPVQSLKVDINPVQDLHGYDSPWPAGGGKNLLNAPDITLTEAGTVYSGPISLATGTYTLSSSNTTVSVTVGEESGVMPLTFTLAEAIEEIEITASGAGEFKNLQIESGSSATSYAPYSNICPISGWTGAKVTRTGTNLFHATEIIGSGWTKYVENTVFKSAGIYTLSLQNKLSVNGADGASIALCDENFNAIGGALAGYRFGDTEMFATVTISEAQTKAKYIAFNFRAGRATIETITDAMMQIELGSTATTYEPYVGQTYPITFPQSAGTVYGGELTLNEDGTAELVVDSAMIASYDGETLPGQWISDRDVYEAGTTPTTGAQVVYKLATPITTTLTAPQVRTLLGINNIWADTGDTTATYRADTKLYIEQLTKPDEYDMIADANIASGKFFMVGNRLFLSTAAIEQDAAIVPGTNCTEFSLADALNTINT